MTDRTRIVIVGAGHNGLVCAAYLAKAGREVLVLEAADRVGGAAVTREFAPGFRVSACAHLLYLLDEGVRSDLGLAAHGLRIARSTLRTVALSPDGDHLVIDGARIESGHVPDADRAALARFRARMLRFARVLARQNPLLKGALAFDAVLGTNLGPRSNNSVLALLHRLSGQAMGPGAGPALPEGGMGAVTAAIAAAAQANGATIRTGSPVARITLEGDRVSGVQLASGETIAAGTVVSNADPARTLLALLGARNLETGFAQRVRHVRMRGTAAKLHLALDALPEFSRLAAGHAGERLVIAPDLVYVEHAFDHSKYGHCSPEPAMEITIPSVHDSTLAPAGQHVLSAILQYAPYDVRANTDAARGEFLERTLGVLERHAPDIRRHIVASQLLLPFDIEREFAMTGGHWHHGELALDQLLMLRPVPGAAQYAMPVGGLFLCGAGCHPGGGVMGSAGGNAARAVLDAERAA
jgi:phytoene dehydrogenase-like protein